MKKNFLQWIVMSAALILFGTTAVAQEVKEEKANGTASTKSTTSTEVSLEESVVEILAGQEKRIKVVPFMGYEKPYFETSYGNVNKVSGLYHTAEIGTDKVSGDIVIVITTSADCKTKDEGAYTVRALQKYDVLGESINMNSSGQGATLIIKVYSK